MSGVSKGKWLHRYQQTVPRAVHVHTNCEDFFVPHIRVAFVKGGTSTFLPLFLALDFSAAQAVGAFPLTEATVTAELLDLVVAATELRFFMLADLGMEAGSVGLRCLDAVLERATWTGGTGACSSISSASSASCCHLVHCYPQWGRVHTYGAENHRSTTPATVITTLSSTCSSCSMQP